MALTNTQFQTLADHIRANTNPGVVAALAIGDHTTITAWYNEAHATAMLWRAEVSPAEYRAAIEYAEVEGMDVGKIGAFGWMTANLTEALDGTKANIRSGLAAIFPANGQGAAPITRAALIALMQRPGTEYEAIFSTGPYPMTPVVEGPLTIAITGKALNQF